MFSILSKSKPVLNRSPRLALPRFRDPFFSGFKALPKHRLHTTT